MKKEKLTEKDLDEFLIFFDLAIDKIIEIKKLSKDFLKSEECKKAFFEFVKKNFKEKLIK